MKFQQSKLSEFPEMTITSINPSKNSANIVHQITTTGPPIHCKVRKLHPEKLAAAKKEFRFLLGQGIIRTSKSPWALYIWAT